MLQKSLTTTYHILCHEDPAIPGYHIFKIPYGKCAGIPFCTQREDPGAGIFYCFRKKCRKQYKISNSYKGVETDGSAKRAIFIKVVKWWKTKIWGNFP